MSDADLPTHFAALYRRYQLDAERWAFGYLRDLDEAEEIAQAAFTAAYQAFSTLRRPDNFAGWLHGIVRNQALCRLRQRPRVQFSETQAIYQDGQLIEYCAHRQEFSPPDRLYEEAQEIQRLQQALASLDSASAQLIGWFYFEGRSHRWISKRTGRSIAAVKSQLYRARLDLKQEMQQHVAK